MSLGDVAAGLGYPVFPCKDDKRPLDKGGFHTATPDQAAIRDAFKRPNADLIAVPTGTPSGLVVIDVDIRPGLSGMEWLDENRYALPETRTHKTRSGGLHLLFEKPEGVSIRNSASRVAPGVDVRGDGGYVIFPPSPGYAIADNAPPAKMPEWLIRACLQPEIEHREVVQVISSGGSTKYGLAALEAECAAIRAAPFGQQETKLNEAALKIGALIAGDQLLESVATSELISAGHSFGTQPGKRPWSASDIAEKVKRGISDGKHRPRRPAERDAPIAIKREHPILPQPPQPIPEQTAYSVFEMLQPGGNKAPHPTVSNCIIILANDPTFACMFGFNEFTNQYLLLAPPPKSNEAHLDMPGPYPRQWDVADIALILAHIQRIWCPKMAKASLEDAMIAEAARLRFHPVREWLASLTWDATPRLDQWLHKAFGAVADPYHSSVGAKFLIAAVRRVRQPGCKFDCLPVLEGGQGIGKSRACAALFGADFFSDSMHPDFGSKDAPMSLVGVWGMELSEIQQMIRNEVEVFKAFLSRPADRYRPPYSKSVLAVPRQSVLIGTTNADDYLRDATGNRRIWPVRCLHADVQWVEANRAQLWAEASAREASGESIWLEDVDMADAAYLAQDDRMMDDVWAEKVAAYVSAYTRTRVSDILDSGLNVPTKDQNRSMQMRVADILKTLGWRKAVIREGKNVHRYWLLEPL